MNVSVSFPVTLFLPFCFSVPASFPFPFPPSLSPSLSPSPSTLMCNLVGSRLQAFWDFWRLWSYHSAKATHLQNCVRCSAFVFICFCKLFSSSASVGRKEAHRTSNRVRIFLALARLLSVSLLLWIRFLTTTVRCSRLVVSQRRENRYSRIFGIVFGQTRQNQTLSGIRPPMLKQGGRGKNSNPPPTLVGGLHFMILVPNPICFDSYDCLISEETYFTGEGKINTFTKLFAI